MQERLDPTATLRTFLALARRSSVIAPGTRNAPAVRSKMGWRRVRSQNSRRHHAEDREWSIDGTKALFDGTLVLGRSLRPGSAPRYRWVVSSVVVTDPDVRAIAVGNAVDPVRGLATGAESGARRQRRREHGHAKGCRDSGDERHPASILAPAFFR